MQMETKEKLICDLETLTKPGPGFNLDQQEEGLPRLLDPERRAGLFQNLEMEIDWSHVDTLLNEGIKVWGRGWACCVFSQVRDCLQAINDVHQILKETKSTLRFLCLFSNKTEVSTFATQTLCPREGSLSS